MNQEINEFLQVKKFAHNICSMHIVFAFDVTSRETWYAFYSGFFNTQKLSF